MFQVLGNFSKRGTGAGFHLMDKDRAALLRAQKMLSFLHYLPRHRRQLMVGGRAGQGRAGDTYAAAVDGQKQER